MIWYDSVGQLHFACSTSNQFFLKNKQLCNVKSQWDKASDGTPFEPILVWVLHTPKLAKHATHLEMMQPNMLHVYESSRYPKGVIFLLYNILDLHDGPWTRHSPTSPLVHSEGLGAWNFPKKSSKTAHEFTSLGRWLIASGRFIKRRLSHSVIGMLFCCWFFRNRVVRPGWVEGLFAAFISFWPYHSHQVSFMSTIWTIDNVHDMNDMKDMNDNNDMNDMNDLKGMKWYE